MAQGDIVCRYVFTQDEFRRALKGHRAFVRILLFVILIAAIVAPLTVHSTNGHAYPHPLPQDFGLRLFINFLPIAIFFGLLFLLSFRQGRSRFKLSPLFNQEMTLTLSDETLTVTFSLVHSIIKWAAFGRAVENKYGFAIYMRGSRAMYWLPKSGFATPSDIDECRLLLRQKVKDTRRLFRF